MVVHVFNRARACSLLSDILVATDSDEVVRERGGVPMVAPVSTGARACSLLSDILVAPDSAEVVGACHTHHIPAVITSSQHASGTDRIWEVSRLRMADVYVNIQGDEP